MKISQMLTPIDQVHWLATTDTVRDALDHMETYVVTAAPLVDWDGRYVGTVTMADVRRHVEGAKERAAAWAAPLARVPRGARYDAVALERDAESLDPHTSMLCFVPVVDGIGKLVGVVDRRRLTVSPVPSAA